MAVQHLNILPNIKNQRFYQKAKSASILQVQLIVIALVLCLCVFMVIQTTSTMPEGRKFTIAAASLSPSTLTIEELVLAKEIFKPISDNYVNLGNRSQLWLKLTIDKSLTNVDQVNNMILVLKKNRIHTPMELHYLATNNTWQKQVVSGNPQFQHNIITRLPNDMLSDTFYLKLQGRYLRSSLFVFNNDEFFEDIKYSTFFSGLFFGMLALFTCYHLMLYLRLKEPSYLAYSAMLFLLGVWFLSGQGWLEYLLPNMSSLHHKTVLIGALLMVAIAEFAKHYLKIKTLSLRLYKGLTLTQLLLLFIVVTKFTLGDFLPEQLYQIGYGIGLFVSFIIFVGCFTAAILAVKKQLTAAWYYLTATLMFFIVASIMGLSAGNIISFNFSWPLLQITSTIEIIIFSAGLVSIYYRQQQNELIVEQQLKQTQLKLVKALEISNNLKDKILNNVVDHKLFPELAKVTDFLADIIYVQALGNDCVVVYTKNNRKAKIALRCNLQSLLDSFGNEYLIRVHKSYLVNPQQLMLLQRRTSADYDVNILSELIPVGRKHLNQIKALV
ncbi:MAG: LytTR family transcriptional regulator DNA-binding domain-containing protein [Colwellia sp.]|nr:LytTR family transcriptional regulator DNA-binding domain-containing protein [Colwellia sp.]